MTNCSKWNLKIYIMDESDQILYDSECKNIYQMVSHPIEPPVLASWSDNSGQWEVSGLVCPAHPDTQTRSWILHWPSEWTVAGVHLAAWDQSTSSSDIASQRIWGCSLCCGLECEWYHAGEQALWSIKIVTIKSINKDFKKFSHRFPQYLNGIHTNSVLGIAWQYVLIKMVDRFRVCINCLISLRKIYLSKWNQVQNNKNINNINNFNCFINPFTQWVYEFWSCY